MTVCPQGAVEGKIIANLIGITLYILVCCAVVFTEPTSQFLIINGPSLDDIACPNSGALRFLMLLWIIVCQVNARQL